MFLLVGCGLSWSWIVVVMGTAGPEALGHLIVECFFNRKLAHPKSASSFLNKPNFKSNDKTRSSKLVVTEVASNQEILLNTPPLDRMEGNKNKKRLRKPWRVDLSRINEENSKAPISTSSLDAFSS